MAFSKITKIILWVVAGISLLVMLFFYISPKTLDYDALDLKVTEALTPVIMTPIAPLPVVDTTEGSVEAEGMEVAEDEGDAITTAEVYDTSVTNLKNVLSGWEYMVWFRTDISLVWAYILLLITLIASIVFPLIAVISNPKALVSLLVVLAGAAVLVIVSYLLSSDTTINIIGYTGTENSDPGTLKMIDTVLFVTYMLFGLALGSILYAIVSRAFK
ncbi:MAG: hypothetical protein KAS82_06405 [Bacteroidales bacterium]|nr:hypothetical protein [Bacteroidales bacterium]